jgi:hypothetical protein
VSSGADSTSRTLIERLHLLGIQLHLELPGSSWHVESFESNAYSFSGLLIVTQSSSDEDLAVLSISREVTNGSWNIDAVGKDAVWLGDSRGMPESLNALMSEDAAVADWVLREVGGSMLTLIIRHLTEERIFTS